MARKKKSVRLRNRRKSQSRVVLPSPVILIIVFIASVSLFYLWVCSRTDSLGGDITKLERKLREMERRRLNEEFKWSNMKSPASMEELLARHGLHMIYPPEHNIVRVKADWESTVFAGAQPTVPKQQFASAPGKYMND